MPTVDTAMNRLKQALASAKMERAQALKIIHGYGSTGKGGAIKQEVHRFLTEKKRLGQIKAFVKGDEFTPFYADARNAIALHPGLTKDKDYGKGNNGISIVVL